MKPLDVFLNAKSRAEKFLLFHHALHNRRQRGTRSDWAENFCRLMHWPKSTTLGRTDGDHCLIVIKDGAKISVEDFASESLDEFLRAAHAGIVAALDRYVHELVIQHILTALRSVDPEDPGPVKKLRIPLLTVQKVVAKAKSRRGKGGKIRPRPMMLVRQALQEMLHQDLTCQSPEEISDALGYLGVKKLWADVAQAMHLPTDGVKKRLNRIAHRRNRIVHEGDIERKVKGGKLRLHPISETEVRQDFDFICDLVSKIDTIVANHFARRPRARRSTITATAISTTTTP